MTTAYVPALIARPQVSRRGVQFGASGQKLSPPEAADQEENRKKTGSFTPAVPLDKKAHIANSARAYSLISAQCPRIRAGGPHHFGSRARLPAC